MAQKLGKDYLRRSAQGQAMLKKLREKKLQTREKGERVLLHKFIKQVYPNYKFYRFHATLLSGGKRRLDMSINDRPPMLETRCLCVTTAMPS